MSCTHDPLAPDFYADLIFRIDRPARDGGRVTLADASPVDACAICTAPDPIGLRVVTATGRRMDTGVCAGCITEALAIRFGRSYVDHGGKVTDLGDPDAEESAP